MGLCLTGEGTPSRGSSGELQLSVEKEQSLSGGQQFWVLELCAMCARAFSTVYRLMVHVMQPHQCSTAPVLKGHVSLLSNACSRGPLR